MTLRRYVPALWSIPAATLALLSCQGGGQVGTYPIAVHGDPRRGLDSIRDRHCGACHQIPGVVGAYGVIGPSLSGFAGRTFVAGLLPNTPDNLVRWIEAPQAIEPRAAMPQLGLGDEEARNVAAYLYTLR
jgi:cytochrome c2